MTLLHWVREFRRFERVAFFNNHSRSIKNKVHDLWTSLKTVERNNYHLRDFCPFVRPSVRPPPCVTAKTTGRFPLNFMFGFFLKY